MEHSAPYYGQRRCWKLTPTSAPSHHGDIGEGDGVPAGVGVGFLPTLEPQVLVCSGACSPQPLKTCSTEKLRLGPSKTRTPTETPASEFSEARGEMHGSIIY